MRRKKGKAIVRNRKKPTFDGISFDSPLELFMYKLLKDNNIEFEFNIKSFILSESFVFENDSFERLTNGKGEFKQRGHKNLRPITYKPDFIVGNEDFIIETKGWSNDLFPMRWKLFKKYLMNTESKAILMKPQNQKECKECLNIILNFYDKGK